MNPTFYQYLNTLLIFDATYISCYCQNEIENVQLNTITTHIRCPLFSSKTIQWTHTHVCMFER